MASIKLEASPWEKLVEAKLAKWFEMYELRKLAQEKKDGNVLAAQIEATYKRTRYVPLAGNAEKAIGDALASHHPQNICVIECKGRLSLTAWAREALPSTESTAEDGGDKKKVRGKNRLHQFGQISKNAAEAEEIGKKCHFLAGYDNDFKDIRAIGYWPFITECSTEDDNREEKFKELFPSNNDGLETVFNTGIDLETAKIYIKALLTYADGTDENEKVLFTFQIYGKLFSLKTTIDRLDFILNRKFGVEHSPEYSRSLSEYLDALKREVEAEAKAKAEAEIGALRQAVGDKSSKPNPDQPTSGASSDMRM